MNHEIRTLRELVKTSSRNCHLVWMMQNKLGHIRDHKIRTPQELKQIPLSNYWFPRHRIHLFGWHDIKIKHRHFKRSWDRTLWEKWITENSAKLFFFKWFSMEKLTFLLTINTFSETLRKAHQLLMSLQKIGSSELYNNIIDKVTIIVSEVRKMTVTCKFRTHVQIKAIITKWLTRSYSEK